MISKIKKTISNIFNPGSILFYPGCTNKYNNPKIKEKYKEILKSLNINTIEIDKILCCGAPAINTGYLNEFETLKNKQLKILKKNQIKKIITLCPTCNLIFNTYYKNEIESKHITQIIAKNKHKINKIYNEKITYHDPCNMSRKNNIINEPRLILETLGFKIIELENNKTKTSCCGAGGELKNNNPKLANLIAKRLLNKVQTKKIVTTCPHCYNHFKENIPKDKKLEIYELSELFK
jgi:Fe-S oxidoreductase